MSKLVFNQVEKTMDHDAYKEGWNSVDTVSDETIVCFFYINQSLYLRFKFLIFYHINSIILPD